MQVMLQVLALVGKIGIAGAYCFIFVVFTELMPTVVRNTGLGIVSTAARIGSIICPYVVYIGKCFLFSVGCFFCSLRVRRERDSKMVSNL